MSRINSKVDRVYPVDYIFKKVEELKQIIDDDILELNADSVHQSSTTTFNADGSITETFESGLTKTTNFNSDGSIIEVYSDPINKTKTITFNSDGSISEVLT